MDAVDQDTVITKKTARQQVNTENKKTAAARPQGGAAFLKVILMSLIEFQNVFPMINFDVWDRLGHVQTIFDTVGL